MNAKRHFYTMPDCRDVYSDFFLLARDLYFFCLFSFFTTKNEKNILTKVDESEKRIRGYLWYLWTRWNVGNGARCTKVSLAHFQLYSLRMYIIVHMKIYSSMRVTLWRRESAQTCTSIYVFIFVHWRKAKYLYGCEKWTRWYLRCLVIYHVVKCI